MTRWFDPNAPLPPAGEAPSPRQIYRRMVGYFWEFRGWMSASIGLAMLSSIFVTLQPWPIKFLIDGVLVDQTVDLGPLGTIVSETNAERLATAGALAGAYFAITVVGVLLNAGSFWVIARTALYMIHTLRSRLVSHLRTLSLRYHANQSIGDMIWRAINDARAIQEVMIFGVQTWATLIFRLAVMMVLMLLLDPILTVLALAVLPPLFFTIHRLTGRIQSASHVSRERMGTLTGLIEQTLGSIRAVQVFGKEGVEQERFAGASLGFVGAQLRFRTWEQVLNVATVVLTGLGTAVVLYVASDRVLSGAVTVGALWVFVSYMQSLYQMMNQIMFVYGPFQDAVIGVGRAFQVLDERADITEAPDAKPLPGFRDAIRFEHVHLEYEPGRPVLRDIDVTVARGERVALVGETGSGKTSVLNLIPRLYDPTAGRVTIDGVDLRQARLGDLRNLVSLVPQEPLLFSTTVRQNILYGRLDATETEIEAAAQSARAHEFIQELSAKYETEVGDRGVRLSVGQQQRISIARAFLKDAPILLLDEPTSALDLRTEAGFLEGLDALMRGRTVIIVAHRLSTIRGVDRIYVLADGVITEAGTHDELLRLGGAYRRLYEAQFEPGATPARA